jgi:tRNA dimethylallyltransferase
MGNAPLPNVTIIAGPTAGGKSARALEYAAQYNRVIINADSQQLYKSLPILTAQPSVDDQKICKHKLYGVLDDGEFMSATKWAEQASALIKQSWHDNTHPILVGGTGFYLKALMDGFSPIPDVPLSVRDKWNNMFKDIGAEQFHAELESVDPIMADKLHPHDKQRLIRAREVLDYTGISLAVWQSKPNEQILPEAIYNVILVMPERNKLYARCNARLQMMMDMGVMDEIMVLDKRLIDKNAPVTKAIGYHELLSYGMGQSSRNQAIELAAQITRNYAKRQVTWFRNQIKKQKNIAQVQHFV